MCNIDLEKLHALTFSPQKLREARERKFPGLSRRRIAKDWLNIPHQTLADYEKGRSTPNPTLLLKLGILYGIDLQELAETSMKP